MKEMKWLMIFLVVLAGCGQGSIAVDALGEVASRETLDETDEMVCGVEGCTEEVCGALLDEDLANVPEEYNSCAVDDPSNPDDGLPPPLPPDGPPDGLLGNVSVGVKFIIGYDLVQRVGSKIQQRVEWEIQQVGRIANLDLDSFGNRFTPSSQLMGVLEDIATPLKISLDLLGINLELSARFNRCQVTSVFAQMIGSIVQRYKYVFLRHPFIGRRICRQRGFVWNQIINPRVQSEIDGFQHAVNQKAFDYLYAHGLNERIVVSVWETKEQRNESAVEVFSNNDPSSPYYFEAFQFTRSQIVQKVEDAIQMLRDLIQKAVDQMNQDQQQEEQPDQGSFACTDGNSVPASFVCDGIVDCSSGEDEDACGQDSPDPACEFQCYDGSCIPLSFKCDWIVDCGYGEDEEQC